MIRTWVTLLVLLCLASRAQAFTLTWDPVITYTDGTPIGTSLDVYRLYHRATSTAPWVVVVDVPAASTTVVLPGAPQLGDYAARAVTTLGIESDDSNVVTVKKPARISITGATK